MFSVHVLKHFAQVDAERIPVIMNEITAASDLLFKRANPQMPCPDVQPFPNLIFRIEKKITEIGKQEKPT